MTTPYRIVEYRMRQPFVSIIIPNYNHAKFLNQRINSVLNQTYKNYEIIILLTILKTIVSTSLNNMKATNIFHTL